MPLDAGKLEEIRKKIDDIDDAIADLLAKRMCYANEVKAEKLRLNRPIIDEQRQNEVKDKWAERARKTRVGSEYDLNEEMMRKIAELIIEYTVRREMEE